MQPRTVALINSVNSIVPAFLVGGAVRDAVMGKTPKDHDFATATLPDGIEERVRRAGRRPFLIGKRFGTVGFKAWNGVEWEMVEVTTFRMDGSGRKPDVAFVDSITADLSRRDFTMNAIAVNPDGHLVDPFGGEDDIRAGIIRAVGNPTIRFKEDPLRMMRMTRFTSTLGFNPDEQTFKKASHHARRILEVSKERITEEMDKLLMGEHVMSALSDLWTTGLMAFILPEVMVQHNLQQHSPFHVWPLHIHTAKVVDRAPMDVDVRWAALLHDVGKPAAKKFKRDGNANFVGHELIGAEMVDSIAARMKWSKKRTAIVRELVLTHMVDGNPLRDADNMSKER